MTTRRWTDTTPRASISDALDVLLTEHGHELLACTEIEVHCLCVDTEPPTQAVYDVTGSLGGRWTVRLTFSARSSHEPVCLCSPCDGTGCGTGSEFGVDLCPICHGFGRGPVRVTCVFDVEGDQVRTAERRPETVEGRIQADRKSRAPHLDADGDRLLNRLGGMGLGPRAAEGCQHLSHRDPRASHFGHCPDCGQVVGAGPFLPAGTACVRCGQPVEQGREEWAHPTCHACLPPPVPLPIRPLPEPVAGPSRPAGSASPDPPAATSPVAPAVAAPSGGGGSSHGFTRATTPTLPASEVPTDSGRPWTEDK